MSIVVGVKEIFVDGAMKEDLDRGGKNDRPAIKACSLNSRLERVLRVMRLASV